MQSKTKLKELMEELGQVYDRKIDKSLIRAYWQALRDYTDAQVEEGVKRTLTICKFFPRPAHLIEAIEQNKKPVEEPKKWATTGHCIKCGKGNSMLWEGECRRCYTGLSVRKIKERLATIAEGAAKKL